MRRPDMQVLALLILLAICADVAFAANDPGHDSLYVLKIGDSNVSGNINITGNLTATLVRVNTRLFGDNLDIRADGSATTAQNFIKATATDLEIGSGSKIILNGGGTAVQVGTVATPAILNVTSSIYSNNKLVCLSDGTNCPTVSGSSSAGGWINTSNFVYGASNTTNLSFGNSTGSLPLFFIDVTGQKVGVGTRAPAQALDVNGSVNISSASGNLNIQFGTLNIAGTTRISNTGVGTFASTTTVNGQNICLADGTNCPATAGYSYWRLNSTGNSTPTNITNNTLIEFLAGTGMTIAHIGSKITITNNFGSTIDSTELTSTTGSGTVVVLNNTPIINTPTLLGATVNSSAATGSFIVGNSTATHLFVNGTGGNIGIGTTNPTTIDSLAAPVLLDVAGGIVFLNGSSLSMKQGANIAAVVRASGNNIFMGDVSNYYSSVQFFSSGAQTITLSGGNANVGAITTPSEKLHVQGNFSTSAGAFLATQAGNVGIGTISPVQILDVNGSINVSGAGATIYINNSQVCTANGVNCPASGAASGGWINTSTLVYGASNLTNLSFGNATGSTPLFYIDNTGKRIGIGTKIPLQTLDINGTVNISGAGATIFINNSMVCTANGVNCPTSGTGNLSFWRLGTDSGTVAQVVNNSLVNITAGTGITVSNSGTVVTITNSGDTNAADDVLTSTAHNNASGSDINVSGAYNALNLQIGPGVVGASELATSISLAASQSLTYGSGTINASHLNNQQSTYYVNTTVAVCYANGTNCPAGAASGGWINTSTYIYSANNISNLSFGNQTGTAPLFFLDNTGKTAGIGTRTPTQSLDVNGSVNVSGATGNLNIQFGTLNVAGVTRIANNGQGTFASGTTVNAQNICLADGTNCPASTPSGGWVNTSTLVYGVSNNTNLSFGNQTGTAPLLFLDNTGKKAGIGTRLPTQSLDVNGSVNVSGTSANLNIQTGVLQIAGTTRIDNAGVGSFASGTTVNGVSICLFSGTGCPIINGSSSAAGWINTTAQVYLSNNATNLTIGSVAGIPNFYVDNTNNRTGIGTALTFQKLDVNGSINVSGAGATIYINNSQVCTANGVNCPASGGGSGGGWLNTSTFIYSVNNVSNLSFGNSTGTAPLLFLDNTGKRIGIGTRVPGNELEVNGTINATAIKVGNTNVLTAAVTSITQGSFMSFSGTPITSTGTISLDSAALVTNIGNWSADKSSYSTTAAANGLYAPLGAVSSAAGWANTSTLVYGASNLTNLSFGNQTGTAPLFFLDNTGKRAGIGTRSPSQTLEVNGTANATNLQVGTTNVTYGTGTTGTLLKYTNGIGQVGNSILSESGTTLTVNGNISIAGPFSIGASAIANNSQALAIGVQAYATTIGTTAVGTNAGYLNTGNYTTALGYGAGYQNTGIQTIAIGVNAGYLNTGQGLIGLGNQAGMQSIGQSVEAIGDSAGYQNNGSGVVAVGSQAAYQNNASYVVALGELAGQKNYGNYLTAVGYNAGLENNGSDNTLLGRTVGYRGTGSNVIAIGPQAAYQNTGNGLITIGYQSGYQNSGAETISLGTYAGYTNTANYVLALGYEAGRNNSGASVIALGYQAGKDNTAANQFIVKQANVNAIPLIQGNFSTGNVAIGTTTAKQKLDVNGSINVSGAGATIYINNSMVCTANGVNCPASSGAANSGWLNTSSQVYLSSNSTNVTVGYLSSTPVFFIDNTNGRIGINTSTPRTSLELVGDGAILANGTLGSGWTEPNLGVGTRMVWYPRKAAFRAGTVSSTNWNDANIGIGSAAVGNSTIANGLNSMAWGSFSWASGPFSTASGGNTIASGNYSTAMGISSTASGNYTLAIGSFSTASGIAAVAMGSSSTASGSYATAMGNSSTASGNSSTAMGSSSTASGSRATAMGNSTASGYAATAMGTGIASNQYATALGQSISSGQWSTAMGNSTASGNYATAMGTSTASGSYATATGYNSIASGDQAMAAGQYTTAAGAYSFAGGFGSVAGNSYIYSYTSSTQTFDIPGDVHTSFANGNILTGYDTDILGDFFTATVSGTPTYSGGFTHVVVTTDVLGGDSGSGTITNLNNAVQGQYSFAMGSFAVANGSVAVATGVGKAYADYTVAMGAGIASATYAVAMGDTTSASGYASTAMGTVSSASGYASTAMGSSTASGNYATAMGLTANASSYTSLVAGRYNVGGGNSTSWVATDPLFELGIGNGTFKANALTVLKNGKVGINTSSPVQALDVNGSINVSGTGATIYINNSMVCLSSGVNCPSSANSAAGWSNSTGLVYGALNTTNLSFGNTTSSKPLFFIDATNQRVAIGTAAPTAKFQVNASSGDIIIGSNASENVFTVNNSGAVFSDFGYLTPAADVAERIPIGEDVEPGDVLVISTTQDEMLVKSQTAYDRTVAGIVSTKPGVMLGDTGEYVALAGRVPVKVTGEVKRGDLLVTSNIAGRAMACTDYAQCSGAILGKALTNSQNGEVIALVSLQ